MKQGKTHWLLVGVLCLAFWLAGSSNEEKLWEELIADAETAYQSGGLQPTFGREPPSWDFAILLFSGVLLLLGFFLLWEAIKTVKWILPDAPAPESGAGLSFVSVLLIIVIWFFREIYLARGEDLIHLVLDSPAKFAPGLLLASLVPGAVAFLKLLTLLAIPPREAERGARRPLLLPVALLGLTLIQVAASIVTLLQVVGR